MIASAVARYARRFHRLLEGKHSTGSPLGAWLLLALVGPATADEQRARLTEILGCDVDSAFDAARRLLAVPHPELAVGSAVWHDPHYETKQLSEFVRRLTPPADAGPMPSQADLDAWARQRTLGLIERFPLDVVTSEGPLVLLLATALAAKVSWEVPFEVTPSSALQLPPGPGFEVSNLLGPPHAPVWQGFVDTADRGPVAACAVRSRRGLVVTSAIGGEHTPPSSVLDAAQSVASTLAAGRQPRRVPLAELPLGDGPAWRISERSQVSSSPERYECYLPAWEAESRHELLPDPDLGFRDAGNALIELLPPDDNYQVEAVQSAVARYTKAGFEAAAVTALGVRTVSAVIEQTRLVRTARIEFTRPHAVVAATDGEGDWAGLPVFSAWISRATEAMESS